MNPPPTLNVIASPDLSGRGNLVPGEIASPVFTEPALMKMGGKLAKAPRNDILNW